MSLIPWRATLTTAVQNVIILGLYSPHASTLFWIEHA